MLVARAHLATLRRTLKTDIHRALLDQGRIARRKTITDMAAAKGPSAPNEQDLGCKSIQAGVQGQKNAIHQDVRGLTLFAPYERRHDVQNALPNQFQIQSLSTRKFVCFASEGS